MCGRSCRHWWLLTGLAALGSISSLVQEARAQGGGSGPGIGSQGAGVVVTPDGVLQVKRFDPRLTELRVKNARESLNPELMRPSELRKVSLTRLEAQIAERLASQQGATEDMKYLAGLTRINYVFFYPETGDIVIAGPAEGYALDPAGRPVGIHTGRAVLELQDLVVALRAYPPGGSATRVIGCSIDPTKEGLAAMQQFLVQITGRVNPGDAGRIADGLRQRLGLQQVTIEGVSPKTHFAQVLVEADYRMKLIGIGLEEPPVRITSYVDRANPRDVARNALQRWFFTPNYECLRVSEDHFAMEVVGDGVKLVGENELVQRDGVRVAATHTDRGSQSFVTSFTAKYGELARRVPVYAQLRNLIDMAIAAAYMQQQDFYGQASWNLGVFASEERFPVEVYSMPETVETAVNAVWKGPALMTPVGGGVTIEPTQALAARNLLADEKQELQSLRTQIAVPAADKSQWWWD